MAPRGTNWPTDLPRSVTHCLPPAWDPAAPRGPLPPSGNCAILSRPLQSWPLAFTSTGMYPHTHAPANSWKHTQWRGLDCSCHFSFTLNRKTTLWSLHVFYSFSCLRDRDTGLFQMSSLCYALPDCDPLSMGLSQIPGTSPCLSNFYLIYLFLVM